MTYLIPFDYIEKNYLSPNVSGVVTGVASKILISREDFLQLVKRLLWAVDVDDEWYSAQYPDVADAIKQGLFKSAKDHFVNNGYEEGRLPCSMDVDEDWYMNRHADVAEGVKNGAFPSAVEHFRLFGYREGRMPKEI